MANEWQVAAYPGLTVYGRIRQAATGYWRRTDTEAFEAYSGANYLLYVYALTAEGTSRYVADLPDLAAGYYGLEGRLRAGATAVEADDGIVSEELGDCSGSFWLPAAPSTGSGFGGEGTVEKPYPIFYPDGVTPLSGCAVYVSSDAEGTTRSETKVTDSLGRVVFSLNPGTVWFWRTASGFLFEDDPDEETVEA